MTDVISGSICRSAGNCMPAVRGESKLSGEISMIELFLVGSPGSLGSRGIDFLELRRGLLGGTMVAGLRDDILLVNTVQESLN